jgi:O-antigen ligase
MSAGTVVALPLVLVFLVIGLRRPMSVILPAYAATVPFGSAISTGLPAPYTAISSVLGILLMLGLGGRLLFGRSAPVGFPSTVSIWLMFLGVAGASAVWSVSPQLTEAGFQNLASLIVLYLLMALTVVEFHDLRRLEFAIVLGGVAAALYGLLQLFALGGLPTSSDGVGGARFGRDLLGANNTAAALLLPLAVALCRSVDWPRLAGRVQWSLSAIVVLAGLVLTGSRGGLLAVGACFVTALVTVVRGRRILVGYMVAALVAVAVVLTLQPAGIGARTDSTDSSGRTDIWRIGIAACRTYCLTGAGWGTFPRVYEMTQPTVPEARVLVRGTSYEPHNIWILIGVEAGLAGLILVAVGLAVTLRDSLRLPSMLRAPPVTGMVATLVAAFFLSNFEYKFFWMGLMYALLCRNVVVRVPAPRPPAPVIGPGRPRPALTAPA